MEMSVSVYPLLSNVSDYIHAVSTKSFCDPLADVWCLDDKVMEYSQLINFVIISGLLGLFGIVTNTIHFIVFNNLGFRETINISLFALSISDFGASIMLVWVSFCFNPLLLHSDVPLDFTEIYYYTGNFPREIFMIISSFITVFVSTERYLCIQFPLKIKTILTKSRVTSIIAAIYVITLASMLYRYSIVSLQWWWDPWKNISVISAFYSDNYRPVEMANLKLQTLYFFSSYLTVAICTGLFAWKLKQRSKWRQAVSGQKDNMTSSSIRDQQITKLVTFVAVLYILCYSPIIAIIFFMFASPEIDIGGKYHNFYMVLESITSTFGAINSSVNIFIYYRMMSKYRATFLALFGRTVKS